MFVDPPVLDAAMRGLVLVTAALVWLLVLVRVNGLRSFSKMTNLDFAMTVAVGSLLAGAGQASDLAAWVQATAAMLALFVVQFALAWARRRSDRVEELLGNTPAVLMKDGVIDEASMRRRRVTTGDLTAKLREANVLELAKVRAVVLEATGDISVLHGDQLEPALLDGTL